MRCTKIDFFVTHGNPTGPTVRYAKALCERAQCETLRCQADQKRDVDGLDE